MDTACGVRDLFELPDEILARILAKVAYTIRFHTLPLVCKGWHSALAQPSEVWKAVCTVDGCPRAARWLSKRASGIEREGAAGIEFLKIRGRTDDRLGLEMDLESGDSWDEERDTTSATSLTLELASCVRLRSLWLLRRTRISTGFGQVLQHVVALPSLESLRITFNAEDPCGDLSCLAALPRLRELDLELTHLCFEACGLLNSLSGLTRLTSLSLAGGEMFSSMFQGVSERISTLQSLEALSIGCRSYVEIGPGVQALTRLSTLMLHTLAAAITVPLPNSLRALDVPALRSLPGLQGCSRLQTLCFRRSMGCFKEEELFEAIGELRELRHLLVEDMRGAVTGPPSLKHLTALTFLCLPTDCLRKGPLPSGPYLCSLHTLVFEGEDRVYPIPSVLTRASSLHTLDLSSPSYRGAQRLRPRDSDFEVLAQMPSLRVLHCDWQATADRETRERLPHLNFVHKPFTWRPDIDPKAPSGFDPLYALYPR